jgi:hypothetical protein
MTRTRKGPTKRQAARKDVRLDQHSPDAARRILGAKTETEAITMALDLVGFRKELVDAVRAMYGTHVADFGN